MGRNIPYKKKTNKLLENVWKSTVVLGKGLLETGYKDAIEYEVIKKKTSYE